MLPVGGRPPNLIENATGPAADDWWLAPATPPSLTENGCAPTALKLGFCSSRSGFWLLPPILDCPTILVAGLPANALPYGPKTAGALAGWVGWVELVPAVSAKTMLSKYSSRCLAAEELSPDMPIDVRSYLPPQSAKTRTDNLLNK